MSLKLPGCRRLAVGLALACGVVAVPAATVVASAASGSPATVANCRASSTDVWAAVEGDGTAGTVFYELEFSNVGSRTCTLRGYPSVWAVSLSGHEIGRSASRRGSPSTVTLHPARLHMQSWGLWTQVPCARVRALRRQDSRSYLPAKAFPRQAKPTRSRTSPYASAPISRR